MPTSPPPQTVNPGSQSGFTGDAAIGFWLLFTALYIMLVALTGGATRLTDSGLSITEWAPILGVIPPLSAADWAESFAKYQKIPEAQQINYDMDLAGFKTIYWWEWSHRLLARMIGILFIVPFLYFWSRGRLKNGRFYYFLGLLLLGGLQGFVGWWMVKSGLVERVDVSQYRLMTHLGLATLLIVLMLFAASREFPLPASLKLPRKRKFMFQAYAIVFLCFLQILMGALVAGLDAGLIYNSWPDMNGAFLPEGAYEDGWISAFEVHASVQFNHRMGAYLLFALALYHVIVLRRAKDPDKAFALVVLAFISVQCVLGILTLLAQVPFDLALAHQFVAFLVIGFATWHASRFRASSG